MRPDHVGRDLPTAPDEHVSVLLREIDGVDQVRIGRVSPITTLTSTSSEETR